MRCSRRIFFLPGAPTLALVILLAAFANLAFPASQATNATTAPPAVSPQGAAAEPHAPDSTDIWNEAAGALAAKIMEHAPAGNALALTVKNSSSLEDDQVVQVRRALRSQLRNLKARLTTTRQAKADVLVTLSENTEGYLWIAEIRPHPSPTAPARNVPNPVVMVAVSRASSNEVPSAEPLSIRKTRLYQQREPILDVAVLGNLPSDTANSPVPATGAARILVLGLDSVSLYEKVSATQDGGKGNWTWRRLETAPLTRPRPWPRDPRGRIVVRTDNQFDVYASGVKCSGSVEPALTLECHESDDPWPLTSAVPAADPVQPATSAPPAAYFTADRNFFDGRVKLDNDHEMKAPPFLAIVVIPQNAALHAGLPPAPGRAPAAAIGPPGWVVSGLDGRAQLLNSAAEAVANVGGWGSQIVAIQSSCGNGWQVLATQSRDLNETDALQAYEIVNRKPIPVSTPVELPGPITEMWPLAGGSEALAIVHNLPTDTYEALRISISCGQ